MRMCMCLALIESWLSLSAGEEGPAVGFTQARRADEPALVEGCST